MNIPLFDGIRLGGVDIANRIVVAPMCQYQAEDGLANDWHVMNLGQYAMGAAGLVFSECVAVEMAGRISGHCLSIHDDVHAQSIARVFDFCRRHGVVKMGMQLGHAGRKASCHRPLDSGKPMDKAAGGWQTYGPSALAYAEGWPVPKEMDEGDLQRVSKAHVDAARRALDMGVDVVELHAAHGYLMHQFLSPLSNQRNDAYGGSFEGRVRYPLEVFKAVRDIWPADRALGVRVSATDWVEGGLTPEEVCDFAKRLAAAGCDFIDVSSGGLDPRQEIPVGPGYQVHLAEAVRTAAGMPTMAVGMIRDPHLANEIVSAGRADMVALARGMMYDPRWAWHAAEELGADTAFAPGYVRAKPANWPQAFPKP